MDITCEVCNQSFTAETNLVRHKKCVHGGQSVTCDQCGTTFNRKDALKRHYKKHSQEKGHQCQHCKREFHRKDIMSDHEKVCKHEDQEEKKRKRDNEGIDEPATKRMKEDNISNEAANTEDPQVEDPCETTALEGSLKKLKYNPRIKEKYDLRQCLQGKKKSLLKQLNKQLPLLRGIKWFANVKVRFIKPKADGTDIIAEPHLRSKCMTTVNSHEIEGQLGEANQKILDACSNFEREGSGWILSEILHLNLNIAQYIPIKGSSYLPLPNKLKNKRAIVNIKNNDSKCFMWSVLAAKHPKCRKDQPNRVAHYQPYANELNFDGIDFPVSVATIPRFEKQNQIAINVFGFEQGNLFPLYITKERFATHVDLLLYSMGEKRHYCLIRDLNRLLASQSKHKAKMFHCPYCLHGFVRQDLLDGHQVLCGQHGAQKIDLPNEDNMFLQFKDFHKQLRVPFVIYADFESLTTRIESTSQDPEKSSTEKFQKHEACGFSYVVVSQRPDYCHSPVVYRGENAVDHFLKSLQREADDIVTLLKEIVPMELTPGEEYEFQTATLCHICGDELGADRVRDHCHVTGTFRGAAHNSCNLNFQFTRRIPVVLHNLRGYDSHLIMQGLGKIKDEINCIPNNLEKYISFSIGKLDFIDSLQFMNASLEKLVSNLAKEGESKFTILKKYIEASKVPLLLRKGVYPYDYMDSVSKFNEPHLPPKEAFYSRLTQEDISDEDYQHAKRVYTAFQLQNLGEYHDLYLKSDVLLLADVFENFRNICLNYYELDPAHYYTSPGLAWSACLKMTNVELELLIDPDMYLFVEEGIRGGMSMISNRYSKANNPYAPNYNPELENNYIMYLDANNLYGWAMSQPLPSHNFCWLSESEVARFEVMDVDGYSEEGYILEVDLEYPQELHDKHSDYPLAPERMKVTSDMLSPYCQQLHEEMNLGGTPVPKLVPNLHNKTRYILHYRNLQLYLSLGMRVTKVHRILTFAQSTWLKSYIDFNTDKRKHAANDFEKDFFKLMNNAVFGKTMENLRKRKNVKLVTNKVRLTKLSASPSFDSFKIFSEDLAAVNMKKTKLYLNRPIYVGFSILDLSKVLMYDFHYNYMLTKYGQQATLLFTDTDSLCYDVKTEDIYRDFQQDLHLFDTSEYPTDHLLYSTINKKVIGKMKDETHGIPIQEFVGLRPKMYSILYTQDNKVVAKKTAKGISKNVTKRVIRHQDYKSCLFEKRPQMAIMNQIRSEGHQLYTVTLNKTSLSPYDDKRHILSNGVTSLAYGHYKIKSL